MFTASSIWVALILVVSVFRGGGAVPLEPRPDPSSLNLVERAAALADLGDYESASRLYYEVLLASPEDVSLWYALGVTLSHLNEREGAEAAFRHVVHRGNPDSEEVRVARQWLVSAGVLARPVVFASALAPDAVVATASVKGKATWDEPGRAGPAPKARILLHGVGGPGEGKRFSARVTLGQAYRFERLPAGSYRLVGSVDGQRLWDLSVDVEDGKETVLDLTRENGANPSVALNQ